MSRDGRYVVCQACGAIYTLLMGGLASSPCSCSSHAWAYVDSIEAARAVRSEAQGGSFTIASRGIAPEDVGFDAFRTLAGLEKHSKQGDDSSEPAPLIVRVRDALRLAFGHLCEVKRVEGDFPLGHTWENDRAVIYLAVHVRRPPEQLGSDR